MQRSESLKELAPALAKAQGAITPAMKDAENKHLGNRYADLNSVWEACRVPLAENGLSVTQLAEFNGDGPFGLRTMLMHASGEFLETFLPIKLPDNANMQMLGTAITYARRYTLAAIAGVASGSDDDGNGNAAGSPQNNARREQRPASNGDRQAAPPASAKKDVIDWAREQIAAANAWYASTNPGAVLCSGEYILIRHLADTLGNGEVFEKGGDAAKFLRAMDINGKRAMKVEAEKFLYTALPEKLGKAGMPAEEQAPASAPAVGALPTNGAHLLAWLKDIDRTYQIEMLKHVNAWAQDQDLADAMVNWDGPTMVLAMSEIVRKLSTLKINVFPNGRIDDAAFFENASKEAALAN